MRTRWNAEDNEGFVLVRVFGITPAYSPSPASSAAELGFETEVGD
jgi:hypothetical protein